MAVQKYWIRAGIVGIVLLLSWVMYISSKQIARNGRIENEVSILENEANKVRRENETLSEKINYFSSADFREQEAKEKLGMKKDREEVVVIQPQREIPKESGEPLVAVTPRVSGVSDSQANYQKWWHIFFSQKTVEER